jgi:hypothetical protein
MFVRIIIASLFVIMSGCAAQQSEPELASVSPPAETDSKPAGEEMELPVAIDPVPDACDLLLASLDTTQPLITSLEETLLAKTGQIEQALQKLNEPPERLVASDCPVASSSIGSKDIIGAIEWLYMDPPGRHFRARVDSGAVTSSLSASDVIEFERDGDDWIRFNFQDDSSDDAVHFELPIKRTVLVRQVSSSRPERRFVVEIDIRLGQQLQTTEFTLTDRSRMTYPVLLGRAFLMDLYVVDVSRSYTHDRYNAGTR